MKVIQLPTKSGKTMIAIRTALANNSLLLVPEESDMNRVINLFKTLCDTSNCAKCNNNMNCSKNLEIHTIEEYLRNYNNYSDRTVVIDDFDKVIENLVGIDSKDITITLGY